MFHNVIFVTKGEIRVGNAIPHVRSAVGKIRGGVHVQHHKNTADQEIVRLPAPDKVVIPMQMNIGAPCAPIVNVGDTVSIGQVIGDTTAFVSTPVHASISGTVTAVGDITLANGVSSRAVTIESDGEMRLFEGLEPPKADTREELIAAVRASGLVGLGGAGFPSHVKLGFKPGTVDTLIVNAAECEPYITVDNRECIENSWDVLSGIQILKEILQIPRVVIAIEKNKPKAITILSSIASQIEKTKGEISVMQLRSVYPQGAEKVMIYSATGRRVPAGKLPSDVGCLVMNVASVAFIARYIKSGKPLVSRSLTVDGSAICTPQNVRVPIGMIIGDIIEHCGGFKVTPHKIITGGPMMGLAVISTDIPVMKQNNAILAFSKEDGLKKETDCINCGRCASACPMNLQASVIARLAKTGDAQALIRAGANVCMECGSCAFSCPAGRPLVQNMRLAKSIIREAAKSNG
ncbi:MAG: electron transport complex subunit RsxC [Clostridia bacterium]|nr:electron transport complex subunit RsxC [Clostridia bacterium]